MNDVQIMPKTLLLCRNPLLNMGLAHRYAAQSSLWSFSHHVGVTPNS